MYYINLCSLYVLDGGVYRFLSKYENKKSGGRTFKDYLPRDWRRKSESCHLYLTENPWVKKEIFERNKEKMAKELTERALQSAYKRNLDTFEKNEQLTQQVSAQTIGLSVGIPTTAGVAAAGGYFAPSILKVLKVLFKFD